MNIDQQKLFALLKKFDKICRENGIEYFLGGGTALGAIRHKGFLHWDDDIDLYIKRDEWVRAKKILKEKLPSNYKIVYMDEFPSYRNCIIRISDINTTRISKSRAFDGSPACMQLELFILDPIPQSETKRTSKYYRDSWMYYECFITRFIVSYGKWDLSKLSLKEYNKQLKKNRHADEKIFFSELKKNLYSYEEKDCDYYHLRWGMDWVNYPKWAFAKQVYVDFEDTKLPVPNGFADVFFGDYGDTWMHIPKISEQETHDTIYNYNVSYYDYEKELLKVIDPALHEESLRKRKRFSVANCFYTDMKQRTQTCLYNQCVLHNYSRKSELSDKIFKAYNENNYTLIAELFSDYYNQQNDSFGKYTLIDLDDDLQYIAIKTKLILGDLRFVEKYKKIKEENSLKNNKKIEQILNDLPRIRKIYFSQYYGEEAKYAEEIEEMLQTYPGQINLIEIKHLIICQNPNTDFQSELQNLDIISSQHPNNDCIMMLKVICLIKQGKTNEAVQLYNMNRDKMTNGMVITKLDGIMERL